MKAKIKCGFCKKKVIEVEEDIFQIFRRAKIACEDCEAVAERERLDMEHKSRYERKKRASECVRAKFPKIYREASVNDLTEGRKLKIENWLISDKWAFFIQGDVGTGKTFCSFAIMAQFAAEMITTDVLFFNSFDLVAEIQDDYSANGNPNFNRIRDCRLLLIDDLGTEKATDDSLSQIMRIVNHREQNRLKTIITTNCSMEELKEKFHTRFISRLGRSEIIVFKGSDRR